MAGYANFGDNKRLKRQKGPAPAGPSRSNFATFRERYRTVSLLLLRSTEFGPAEMVKVPGSTTRFISRL